MVAGTSCVGELARDAQAGRSGARVALHLGLGGAHGAPGDQLGLGLVARASPRIQVFFIGMPLRAGLGIAVLALVLSRAMRLVPGIVRESLASASGLLSG